MGYRAVHAIQAIDLVNFVIGSTLHSHLRELPLGSAKSMYDPNKSGHATDSMTKPDILLQSKQSVMRRVQSNIMSLSL